MLPHKVSCVWCDSEAFKAIGKTFRCSNPTCNRYMTVTHLNEHRYLVRSVLTSDRRRRQEEQEWSD